MLHESPGGPIYFFISSFSLALSFFTIKNLNRHHIHLLMEFPTEHPLYTLYESKSRALVPKVASLVVLSLIFYLGILLNVSLLELSAGQETTLKTGSLI